MDHSNNNQTPIRVGSFGEPFEVIYETLCGIAITVSKKFLTVLDAFDTQIAKSRRIAAEVRANREKQIERRMDYVL
jgi:hypothetical protein